MCRFVDLRLTRGRGNYLGERERRIMDKNIFFHRLDKTSGILTTVFKGSVEEVDDIEESFNNPGCVTNMRMIRRMSITEMTMLLRDIENFDNPDYEWQSIIDPPLPFESWGMWLDRQWIRRKQDGINK